MAELQRLSAIEFRAAEKHDFSLLLDNVRSLLNVGSVFRTADAFRAEKIYLSGITGTPPHRDITKTALGADDTVAWQYVPEPAALVQGLRQNPHLRVVAVEQTHRSIGLPAFRPAPGEHYLFIFGNEVEGVQESLLHQADICLEIPQFGTKHSLNISVAAGVVCWDFLYKKYFQE